MKYRFGIGGGGQKHGLETGLGGDGDTTLVSPEILGYAIGEEIEAVPAADGTAEVEPGPPRSVPNILNGRRGGRKIKRIPPELRRRRIDFAREPRWYRRLLWRWKEDSQFQRSSVQLAFVVLCVWIGVEFHFFMQWGMNGGEQGLSTRPPGVEGFLPISALISLSYWLQTGILNDIHPAALIILLAIICVSIAVKKAFCSWLCPIGMLSESLWMLAGGYSRRIYHFPAGLIIPSAR